MLRESTSDRPAPDAARDARRVTSELGEMLAVVVVPAMLLSGFSLFFS